MTMNSVARRAGLAAAVLATAGLGLASSAMALSKRVENACRGDYHTFCPGYSIDSPALRHCMKSAGKSLSIGCRRALASEGEIPAKYAR